MIRTSDENLAMKAKRQFSTGASLPVKPICPAPDRLSQARGRSAFNKQRQTDVLPDSSIRSITVFPYLTSLTLVLSSALLLAACKGSSGDSTLEVAAKVGSRDITLKQVDSTINQQLDASGPGASMTSAELVAAR